MARIWENKQGNITEKIAAEKVLERNVSSNLEVRVEEVQEFERTCENIEIEEERNSDKDGKKHTTNNATINLTRTNNKGNQ